MNLKQQVVFIILMQGGGGVLDKAPSYMEEKFESIKNSDEPEALLDSINMRIFNTYMELWCKEE